MLKKISYKYGAYLLKQIEEIEQQLKLIKQEIRDTRGYNVWYQKVGTKDVFKQYQSVSARQLDMIIKKGLRERKKELIARKAKILKQLQQAEGV